MGSMERKQKTENRMIISEQKNVSKIELYILGLVLISAVLSFMAVGASAIGDSSLRVYFLDVGQGDAIFIQNANGNQVLIDGGPDNKVIQELSKIMPFNDRSIDLVILTHPHADHVNGLIEVLRRYDISQILENYYAYNTPEYGEWNKLKSEAVVTQASVGQTIDLGLGAKIKILYPFPENSGQQPVNNPNNASVVAKLIFGNESVLLVGDAELPVEKKMIAMGEDLDSDFLKAGHHGSKTSTSEELLKAVTPKAVFIEVGAKNTYGHPSPEVLNRLDNFGIKYYRTDIDGTVKLILNGRDYSISSL